MNIEIFIPCFNEELNIEKLFNSWLDVLDKTKGYNLKIIFIDNGSSDSTNSILNSLIDENSKNLRLLVKKVNTGYGDGILYGIKNSNAEYVGWAHADLQFDPVIIINKLNSVFVYMKKEKFILTGKRLNRNIFDIFFTKLMTFVVFLFTTIWITDINAQPKIFSKNLLTKFENPPRNFNLDLYTLLTAKKNNYIFDSIDVNYNDRKYGEAKGGGTLKGKYNLIIQVLKFLLFKK